MLDRLEGVFRSLETHEVRYLVIGGIAAVLHGVPRATFDLDLLIEASPDNAGRLLAALLEAGLGTAALTTPAAVIENETTVFRDKVRIDVFTAAPGIAFSEAWGRRQVVRYRGQALSLVSRDDLVASKRAAGRPVDLEDVRLLDLPDTPAS